MAVSLLICSQLQRVGYGRVKISNLLLGDRFVAFQAFAG
jgi:hypothetical protein